MPKEQWIVVDNTHPAIIEKSDFNKVQLLINNRKKTRTRTYDYLLKGLIYCKECGYPLGVINRVLSGNIPTLYFVCRTYQRFTKAKLCSCHCIRVETVTDAIIERVKALCRKHIDKNELNNVAKTVINEVKTIDGREAEIKRLFKQISNITSNMDKLYSDKLNGILDETDFQRFYSKLRIEREANQNKTATLQSQVTVNKELIYNIDDLIEKFIQSAEQNRELICSLIEKIELTEEKEVYIHFRFSEMKALQEG